MAEAHPSAYAYAHEAHEDHFSARRGVWVIEDGPDAPALVVYSNHFYKHRPTLQDDERAFLRRRFAEEGIGVRGEATYPAGGAEDGYTYAMVLDATGAQGELVTDILDEAVLTSLRSLGEGR